MNNRLVENIKQEIEQITSEITSQEDVFGKTIMYLVVIKNVLYAIQKVFFALFIILSILLAVNVAEFILK